MSRFGQERIVNVEAVTVVGPRRSLDEVREGGAPAFVLATRLVASRYASP